jgi:hypothetical protein
VSDAPTPLSAIERKRLLGSFRYLLSRHTSKRILLFDDAGHHYSDLVDLPSDEVGDLHLHIHEIMLMCS